MWNYGIFADEKKDDRRLKHCFEYITLVLKYNRVTAADISLRMDKIMRK